MAEQGIAEVVWQAPQPRIVQYRNRRYSIRLEPVFWRTLEFLAERHGLRLGRFIGELAEDYDGPNFASHLRVVCMTETERARAEASLRPSRVNVVDLILSCPSPGLVLSRYRTVLAFNPSFAQWIGAGNEPATGAVAAPAEPPRRRAVLRFFEAIVRGLLRLAGRAPRRDPALLEGPGTRLSFRLRLDPGGPMAPMINAMIKPLMLPAAESLANQILAHLEGGNA